MHTPIRRASKLRWQNDRFHLPFINPILSPAKPRKKQTTKTKLSLASLALLGALHFATPPLRAQDGSDRVHIDVRVAADQDRKDIKGSSADTVTQNKTLEITITGKPKNPETRTGKWTVYGRSVSGHDLTAVGSGEFKLELPATGQQKIVSQKVSATYTPEHAVSSGTGTRTKAKKVDATGTKYVGYSVVVKDGEKVVGEAAEPMGIAKEAAK